MSMFATYTEKAEAAVGRNRAALERAEGALQNHDNDPRKDSDDGDVRYEWKRERRDLEDRRDAAAEALELSEQRAEQARAEAAEKAAEAERAAVEKEAEKLKSLVREIAEDSSKLKAKIAKLEEHRERARAAGVEDAEVRERRQPSTKLPAMTQTNHAWFDTEGNRYGSDYGHDDEGRWVKMPGREQREVVDVIRAEMTLPGEMPERFASAIRLVDLEGRPL